MSDFRPGFRVNAASYLGLLAAAYIFMSYIQRTIYIVWICISTQHLPEQITLAFAKGLLFDLGATFYILAPAAILLTLTPRRFYRRLWFKIGLTVLTLIPLLLATCSAVGELFFFDEFHARYNFIAVDYLVYTNEVVLNILESYSLVALSAAILVPILSLIFLLRWLVGKLASAEALARPWRSFAIALMFILCAAFLSEDRLLGNDTYWPREISKNSLFALFSAYHRNSINYNDFYASLETSESYRVSRDWLGGDAKAPVTPNSLFRDVTSETAEKKWNVVMVVMESMSAGFLGHFGNRQPITPNLDRLADEGLFFTNLYATGTRTVRGLEALMLSLPPTPGQSILRRPNSDHLFNLATIFADHGYRNQFLYGGYAYFDNMKEWFEGNGFEVVDRASFPNEEIEFANAWGVCDENLFAQTLKQEAAIFRAGKPFFQVIMTTSNHRPYTFPEGRIDIPPHTGREGAIKYSDYAIGKFLDAAKQKPWFNNTLFIFVADHDASVAGGTDIPVHDYLIPAIFYNPTLVPPQKIATLSSQIDLAPTLLGLLGFSYQSRFFGQDLRRPSQERALLGTYQKVAMLQKGLLTILAPGHTVESQTLDENFSVKKTSLVTAKDSGSLTAAARLTVAIYQSASDLFSGGFLKTTTHDKNP